MTSTCSIAPKKNEHVDSTRQHIVSAQDVKHCIFNCSGSGYALPAVAIREITHAPPLVPVPLSPETLAGLCHIRSEFIPVLCLDRLLRQSESHQDRPQLQLLVLSDSAGPWALLIDQVVAIDSIETHVDASHRNEGQIVPVLGTATHRANVIRVLSANALHRMASESLKKRWDSKPRRSAIVAN